jgi:hypothetical protein
MDHLDAEHMRAVERYVLGDLTVSEVEEFERHFFDCPQCSEELRALTVFQENARAVFAEQDLAIPASKPVPESAAGWWNRLSSLGLPSIGSRQWAVAACALLIGIFSGYLASSSPEKVQAVSAYPLYAQARGEETMVSPSSSSKFYTLYLDKTWDGDYSSYRAVLQDAASGTEKFAVTVAPGTPGEAIHVLIPSHQFAPGRYVLVMYGAGKDAELARFPFTFQFK